MVTSTPMSTYWFIALNGRKRYLMNDIHSWPKIEHSNLSCITQLLSIRRAAALGTAKWSWMGGQLSNIMGAFSMVLSNATMKMTGTIQWGWPLGVPVTQWRKDEWPEERGFTIRFRWEHKWAAMKRNRWGAHGLSQDQTVQALIPRDAFWQQVNALRLYYKAAPDEKIHQPPTSGW